MGLLFLVGMVLLSTVHHSLRSGKSYIHVRFLPVGEWRFEEEPAFLASGDIVSSKKYGVIDVTEVQDFGGGHRARIER